VVLGEAVADHLGLVIVADLEPCAAEVADALLGGRIELDVEDVSLLGADPPAAEAPHDLVVRDVDQERRGQAATELAHLRVECLGLAGGTREAVEDEPVARLLLGDAVGDQPHHHLVRDQVASVHVLLCLPAELGAVAHRRAQDVPGGVVGQAEILLQSLPLGPLA
jgi:hypothetical protein